MSQQTNLSSTQPEPTLGEQIKESIAHAGELIAETATEIKDAVVELMQGKDSDTIDSSYQTPIIDKMVDETIRVEDKPREQREFSPKTMDKTGYVSIGSETLPLPPSSPRDATQLKVDEAAEVLKARKADVDYNINKAKLKDSNAPIADRLSAIPNMVGDAVEGAKHRAGQERIKNINEPTIADTAKESWNNAGAYVSETVQDAKQSLAQAGDKINETVKDAKEAVLDKANEASRLVEEKKAKMGKPNDPLANKSSEASEALKARKADVNYNIHKAEAKNPNAPITDRMVAGTKLVGDAIEGATHKAGQEYYKSPSLADKAQESWNKLESSLPSTKDTLGNKTSEASAALKARKADVDYNIHKAEAKNSNAPVGDRLAAGANMVGDAVEGAKHRAAQGYYQNLSGTTTLGNQASAASEYAQEKKADASYYDHKAQAKDTTAPLGDRIKASASMAGDALESAQHQGAKAYYKNI